MEPSVANTRRGWWVLVAAGGGDFLHVVPMEIKEKDRKHYRLLGSSRSDGLWGAPLYDLEGAAQLRAKQYTEALRRGACHPSVRFIAYERVRVLVTPNVGSKDDE